MRVKRPIRYSIGAFVLLFVANFLFLPYASPVGAEEHLSMDVKSAILVEANTGKILYKMNEKEALPPASMTKMMTEYLVLEAVEQGKISWEQSVSITDGAASMEGSQVWLYPSEQRTVKELFTAMAVYSANDATRALAELLSGSEDSFVQFMNEKATEIGLKNTHFLTSSGYPVDDMKPEFRPQGTGEHVMSAEDAAILGRELVKNHPEIFEFTTIPKTTFREGEGQGEVVIHNWNWLIDPLVFAYEGADGLKTGNTEAAGYCITATAQRGDMRLIAVIMGADSIENRFKEVRKLLDYGFNNFVYKTMLQGKEPIAGYETAPVEKGRQMEVPVVTKNSLSTILKKGEESKYVPEVLLNQDLLVAPLDTQRTVGQVQLTYTGDFSYEFLSVVPEAQRDRVELVTQEEMKKANWLRLFFRSLKDTIVGLFRGVSEGV